MRDAGLEQAIKAAGGIASLARAIGIAQPSVSAWSRIPPERVLAVEALTRVHRFILRPDLYGPSEDQVSSKSEVDEIDQLRAAEYGLLSLRLGIERAGSSREPEDHIAILLEVMAGLARGDFEADFSEQARFFERHLKPWAARMFAELEMSRSAKFYRAVGRVGRVFMELESEAFTLS